VFPSMPAVPSGKDSFTFFYFNIRIMYTH
jgi:hypothetical protein